MLSWNWEKLKSCCWWALLVFLLNPVGEDCKISKINFLFTFRITKPKGKKRKYETNKNENDYGENSENLCKSWESFHVSFFKILEAQYASSCKLVGERFLAPTNESVPVWLLIDKGLKLWMVRDEKFSWQRLWLVREKLFVLSLHLSFESSVKMPFRQKASESRENPVSAASKFYVSIVIVGVVKDEVTRRGPSCNL